jgi:LssY C-terminus
VCKTRHHLRILFDSELPMLNNHGYRSVGVSSVQPSRMRGPASRRAASNMHLADYRRIPAYILLLLFALPQSLFAWDSSATASDLVIPDGTAIHLRLSQTVSSTKARVGDPLDFIVEKDVSVGDHTIIRAGSIARGSVTEVKGRRILGIGGKVVFQLDSVNLVTGETVKLRARREVKGTSHTWRMIAGMATAAVFYLPAAPIFLLARGGSSTVLRNTEVTAQIDGSPSVVATDFPRASKNAPGLDDMLENLQGRVLDGEGREGDMVNLVFIAQDDDLQKAFAKGGWVKPDKWKPVMAWHLLTRRTHDAVLPIARFYMFGRVQDHSYALPDPAATMSHRHHLRIWKTGYTVDGISVWAGAATHDIAIEIAKRGHILNHWIDPQVDAERDFIGSNLTATSLVHHEEYLQTANPVLEATTTSGEAYHSDGRILLLDLHLSNSNIAELHETTSGVDESISILAPTSARIASSSVIQPR